MRPAADALYRAHGEAVFRYLVRMSGDPEVAGDVLHDTFRRLMERPPQKNENIRGWLFKVATNRLRDLGRAARRRRSAMHRSAPGSGHSDPTPLPDRQLEAREARERASAVLAALPERDRAILLMREEGFTHREIAEAVGTTTGSIGTMIARALDRAAEAAGITEARP